MARWKFWVRISPRWRAAESRDSADRHRRWAGGPRSDGAWGWDEAPPRGAQESESVGRRPRAGSQVCPPRVWPPVRWPALPGTAGLVAGRDASLPSFPARLYRLGYKDGSFYPVGKVAGLRTLSDERRFANVLEEIKKGKEGFSYDRAINQDRWREFVSLVQYARREKIRLITFLTPLPNRILDVMARMADKYDYIEELRLQLPGASEHYYDFLDHRSFGSSDCEFIDGKHGGEVTYLRLLQEIGLDPA